MVLLPAGHLVRSATARVAGVDTSARGSWRQLVCVVPTFLVESVEGCWEGLMQTIVLQKQTRGEDQSPVQRLGQNRLLQQCTYMMAAARVSERFGYFQILMARNALTYEGWPGASGWNNVHQ